LIFFPYKENLWTINMFLLISNHDNENLTKFGLTGRKIILYPAQKHIYVNHNNNPHLLNKKFKLFKIWRNLRLCWCLLVVHTQYCTFLYINRLPLHRQFFTIILRPVFNSIENIGCRAMYKMWKIILYNIIILQISRTKWKYKQNEKSTVEWTKKGWKYILKKYMNIGR